MRVNNILLIFTLIITLSGGCIEPFRPDLDDNQQLIVINGTLTDKEGYHYINVSLSVPYESPENVPVQGCSVEVIDDTGNSIQFYESEPGLYEQWIDQEFLKTGRKYKLRVTAEDSLYESRYETLLPCPPVQDIYYEIEKKETADPEKTIHGIQFYTDLVAHNGYARNYRWELEETWEYHAEYLIRYYLQYNSRNDLGSESDSLYYCWSTNSINEIYTGTINHLTKDSLARIPLRYVSNETSRLKVRYSLFINQYSLSDTAYEYWNQLKKQHQEAGGLYEIQPQQIRGNIYNINNKDENVLGNFNVSGLSAKRVFVSERFNFFPENYDCVLYEPRFTPPSSKWPIWIIIDHWGKLLLANNQFCFDCTKSGGTTEKPYFW